MKALSLAIRTLVAAQLIATLQAQDGVLDLTTLANYANQPRPAYITRNNTPAGNETTNVGAPLGRVLFYDKRLSRNNTISCSSCHQQARAFSDTAIASTGVNGTTGRHSMRLINSRFAQEPRFFWDERAPNLETQATQPVKDHVEMGFSGTLGDPAFADLVTKLSAIPEYRVLFAMTFGSATIDETRVQRALAQFVRSIQSFDSKYDAGRAVAPDNQPFPNFTASENAGKQLFLAAPHNGGAGCGVCHRPPEFDIDPNSDNNGVIGSLAGGADLTNTRAPSLRDMIGPNGQSNGPFMHNGVFSTLGQVINHYNAIPGNNPNLDPRLRRPGGGVQNLNLTQQQRNDLVAFLGTLTGSAVYSDAKWSTPFSSSDGLSLIVLPTSATTLTDHGNSTATLSCNAAAGLQYELQSSNDLQSWSTIETITPDAAGNMGRVVPISGSTFYRFTFTPPGS